MFVKVQQHAMVSPSVLRLAPRLLDGVPLSRGCHEHMCSAGYCREDASAERVSTCIELPRDVIDTIADERDHCHVRCAGTRKREERCRLHLHSQHASLSPQPKLIGRFPIRCIGRPCGASPYVGSDRAQFLRQQLR